VTGTAQRVAPGRPWSPEDTIDRPLDEIGAVLPDQEIRESRPLPPPDDHRLDQPGTHRISQPLIIGLVMLAVAGIVVAAILVLHPFGGHHAPPITSPSSPSSAPVTASPSPVITSASPSPTPTPGSQQQAAGGLGALLSQSVGDRNAVNSAYNDLQQCGPNLGQDAQPFRAAAASRQRLLSQLAALPSRSALPPQMLQDLTSAWQASVEADQDFAAWAQDLASGGCAPKQSDPNLQAATGPDLRATKYKKAFLRRWNPLATEYSLTTYQQNEL
jgi:hypothetical protein